jgi:signal transduction histidine kinase/CheY-like chemotaxis protein
MKVVSRTLNYIKSVLDADSDPIDRARMRVLFYTMSIAGVFTGGLIVAYGLYGPTLQLCRSIILCLSMCYGIYSMFRSRNYKPAAHIVIFLLTMMVWSNIFLIIKAINIVTIQYILMAITCSFYLLNARSGMVYSIVVMAPVLIHVLLKGADNIQVTVSSQQASDPIFVTVMMFNFFLLIFINYHFLKAFHFAINLLKESQKDEKLLNEKLKEAIAIAEASSKAKSDFLSTMSHELRTPLNSVIGMSYVLLADNPRADQEENMKVLHFSAESLLSLINDILDFNKLEYGKLELESIVFSPSELIRGIYSGLKFQAEEKGLEFTLDLDDRLSDVQLQGDSTRLLQILFNLIGNAIKFTSKGRVTLLVEIVEQTFDFTELKFIVKDTGIGISVAQQDIIFEPFSQASSNITRKFGGTGLGLAITKQLLDLHGSDINMNSEVGKGTTFEFQIKYRRVSERDGIGISVSKLQTPSNADLSELKILVAEDNAMNILLMKKLFSSWEVNADFVVNGNEALENALQNLYDVILMDIHMPVMDGYEASRQILEFYKGKSKKPWMIALTASVANDISHKISAAGLDDYILKPFNPVDLKNRLASLTNRKDRIQ